MQPAFLEVRPIPSVRAEPVSLVVDREGIIRAVSPGHSSWLGPGRHRLLGHPWWGLVHRHDLDLALHYVQCVQDGVAGPRVWRVRVRTGTGTWRWAQMMAMRQHDGFIRLWLNPLEAAG